MVNKIFFSIVIPVYNSSNFIEKALISIKKQTYNNYEVIIVDDFSRDYRELVDIVQKCEVINLRIIRRGSNSGGPAAPRNIGIRAAKGDWICFLDADDYWFDKKLEIIKNKIKILNFDLIYHSELHINTSGHSNPIIYNDILSKNQYKELLERGNKISTSATTIKRDFLIKNKLEFDEDIRLSIVEDYDLWLRIAFNEGRFYTLNQILGEYLINETSMINNIELMKNNHFNLYKKHNKKLIILQTKND